MKAKLLTPFAHLAMAPYTPDDKPWDGERWCILHPVVFMMGDKTYTIEIGFVTDQGSVPRAMRGAVDDDDESIGGFIVHDWLYTKGTAPVTRAEADQVLCQLIAATQQSWWRKEKTYWAVRAGGGFAGFKKTPISYDREYAAHVLKSCSDAFQG